MAEKNSKKNDEGTEKTDATATATQGKYRYRPRTAADVVGEWTDTVAADAQERADEAGVLRASHIDYEPAMENYESRSDVETLEARRAREAGTSFYDASFRRDATVAEAGLVVADKPDTVPAADTKTEEAAPSDDAKADESNKSK